MLRSCADVLTLVTALSCAVLCCAVCGPQAWQVAERLNLIGPSCEQPEYNMFARKKVWSVWLWVCCCLGYAPLFSMHCRGTHYRGLWAAVAVHMCRWRKSSSPSMRGVCSTELAGRNLARARREGRG
jgi:hypothetical protein